MAYVVTEPCRGCKDTACVTVCPCDCFREGPDFLVIFPDDCIDCDACVAECPVDAIFYEEDVPEDQRPMIAFNDRQSRVLPPITEALAD